MEIASYLFSSSKKLPIPNENIVTSQAAIGAIYRLFAFNEKWTIFGPSELHSEIVPILFLRKSIFLVREHFVYEINRNGEKNSFQTPWSGSDTEEVKNFRF